MRNGFKGILVFFIFRVGGRGVWRFFFCRGRKGIVFIKGSGSIGRRVVLGDREEDIRSGYFFFVGRGLRLTFFRFVLWIFYFESYVLFLGSIYYIRVVWSG